MPRITRKQQKIFAESASNNGVFGSLQANDPTLSSDPDAIQGRTAYANGWNDATYSADELPPLEEFQALQYLFSRQIAYIMQEGVAEWDASTTYYKGNLVKAVQSDGSFILYASLIDNNTGNAVSDTTKWVITNTSTNFHQGIPNWRADVIYSEGDWVKSQNDGEWSIFESKQNNNLNNVITDTDYWDKRSFSGNTPLLSFVFADHLLNDISWLRVDTFSWQSGDVYVAVYDHLVDDFTNGISQTETIGATTISYVLADDGHKIVDVSNVSDVEAIYNETGISWYYVIDTTNERFKLPRTKYAFTGLRDTVGKYVPESLPQHTHNYQEWGRTGGGNIGYDTNNHMVYYNETRETAGSNNSTYQDNAPVQQRATQMYLYFFVGNYKQSAVEQTAGLNSELFDDKLDLDLGNASTTTKETIVGWGMPDYSAGIAITAGASGSYTALTDGMFIFSALTNNTTGKVYVNNSVVSSQTSGGAYLTLEVQVVVSKDDIISWENVFAGAEAIFYPLKGV